MAKEPSLNKTQLRILSVVLNCNNPSIQGFVLMNMLGMKGKTEAFGQEINALAKANLIGHAGAGPYTPEGIEETSYYIVASNRAYVTARLGRDFTPAKLDETQMRILSVVFNDTNPSVRGFVLMDRVGMKGKHEAFLAAMEPLVDGNVVAYAGTPPYTPAGMEDASFYITPSNAGFVKAKLQQNPPTFPAK